MDITKFINELSIDEIQQQLPSLLNKMSNYCDTILGRGMMGYSIRLIRLTYSWADAQLYAC